MSQTNALKTVTVECAFCGVKFEKDAGQAKARTRICLKEKGYQGKVTFFCSRSHHASYYHREFGHNLK